MLEQSASPPRLTVLPAPARQLLGQAYLATIASFRIRICAIHDHL